MLNAAEIDGAVLFRAIATPAVELASLGPARNIPMGISRIGAMKRCNDAAFNFQKLSIGLYELAAANSDGVA